VLRPCADETGCSGTASTGLTWNVIFASERSGSAALRTPVASQGVGKRAIRSTKRIWSTKSVASSLAAPAPECGIALDVVADMNYPLEKVVRGHFSDLKWGFLSD
jgi:hypothetical protein